MAFLTTLFSPLATFDPAPALILILVLALFGYDIAGSATAQVGGSGLAPVTFSFGSVGYAVRVLIRIVLGRKVTTEDRDVECKVINGVSGIGRENRSWILSRIMHDFDHWMHDDAKDKLQGILLERHASMKETDINAEFPPQAGLLVSIYEPSETIETGTVKHDRVFWSGLWAMALQLVIALAFFAVNGERGALSITVASTALTAATMLLPQWKEEKWACRRNSTDPFVLTRGNGFQHAIVVLGNGRGVNLEDLASANHKKASGWRITATCLTLAVGWVLQLLLAGDHKSQVWPLAIIGAVGFVQNLYAAAKARRPENFGLQLDFVETIGYGKVMETLFAVEEKYPSLGRSMLDEFFQKGVRSHEKEIWDKFKAKADGGKPKKS